ncbi:MAG TPA: protein-export chaperone SecB, partial [Coxiellaceae bacterium]|nr:protein-export chaperone SecB [Coxiellaceae bacterium]
MDLNLDTKANNLDANIREVVLTVTVTVKVKEQMAFLVEVKQAGIFTIQGFNDEQLEHMLGSFCPTILYPYAREAITDLVVRGGFPQLYLNPINFDLLFEQAKQKNKPQIIQ